MKMKKMMQSILLLGIFWYAYVGYILIVEMDMNPILLVLLTAILWIFIKAVKPLCDYVAQHQKKVN